MSRARMSEHAGPREILAVGVIQALYPFGIVAAAHAWPIIRRPAWLDEYHTLFVAGSGSLVDGMRALLAGADFNPPLLPLMLRGLGAIIGGLDTTGGSMAPLRAFSFACVWLAVLTLYCTLRTRFDWQASLISTFALWIEPLVLEQAFEVRFYGPWLLFAALLAYLLIRADTLSVFVRGASLALASVAICLIHYFGIFTWMLAVAGFFLSRRSVDTKVRREVFLASLAGPFSLAACAPFYFGQRAALSVATWIAPSTWLDSLAFLSEAYRNGVFVVAICYLVGRLAVIPGRSSDDFRNGREWIQYLAPLGSLALMPLVIVAFSVIVQPSSVARYAIVGIVGLSPAVAWSLSRLRPRARLGACGGLAVLGVIVSRAESQRYTYNSEIWTSLAREIERRAAPDQPIVFLDRHLMYPVTFQLPPHLRTSLVFAEIPDSIMPQARPFEIVERDAARVHARHFGFPRLRAIPSLATEPSFWLVALDERTDRVGRWFPDRSVVPVSPHLFLSSKDTATAPISIGESARQPPS